MSEAPVRELFDRYVRLLNERDFTGLRSVLDPEYVEEYPQSGERIRGPENAVAVLAAYPGGVGSLDTERSRVVSGDEHWRAPDVERFDRSRHVTDA